MALFHEGIGFSSKSCVRVSFLNTPGSIKRKAFDSIFIFAQLLKDIIVKPTKASVCHADLRYYTGNRRPEALAKKLPMVQ
jgi:hypothetical protein